MTVFVEPPPLPIGNDNAVHDTIFATHDNRKISPGPAFKFSREFERGAGRYFWRIEKGEIITDPNRWRMHRERLHSNRRAQK